MQLSKTIYMSMAVLVLAISATPVFAEPAAKGKASTTYTEDEFLRSFSGKSRKVIAERLGAPVKKEQAVQPSNAAGVVGQQLDTSKPVNVEMWYYNNLVKYEPKKTYKMTELTFVNDRCMNIAFFNNK